MNDATVIAVERGHAERADMWRRHTETQQLNTTTIMPNQPSAQEHHNCQSSCILILLDCFKRYTRTASDLQSPPAVPLCEFHRGEEGKKRKKGGSGMQSTSINEAANTLSIDTLKWINCFRSKETRQGFAHQICPCQQPSSHPKH